MKRDNLCWRIGLILPGVLLFLQTQGYIRNLFPYLWPLGLILVGSWFILGVYLPPSRSEEETFPIPLAAAKSARFKFSHGAGQRLISKLGSVTVM